MARVLPQRPAQQLQTYEFAADPGAPSRQAGVIVPDGTALDHRLSPGASHLPLNRLYTSSDTVLAIARQAPRTISTIPNGGRPEGGEDKGGRLSDANGDGLGDADGDRDGDGEGLCLERLTHVAESTFI
jgi:hypothetical protein